MAAISGSVRPNSLPQSGTNVKADNVAKFAK